MSIFLNPRAQQIDLQKFPIPFAPNIAVEVLSPSEAAVDVNRKILDYLAAGTQEVWVLDYTNRELFLYSNSGIRLFHGSDRLETPLLPGLSFTVADLLINLPE